MADLQAAAVNAANQAGVDPDWFTSLIGNGENGFANPGAVSAAGARGPGQLMPATAAGLGVRNIDDPVQNLQGAAQYARQQWDRFGDPSLAAAAYNAGPEAVAKYGGVPPFPETRAYVQRVMGGVKPLSDDQLQADFAASQAPSQSPAANFGGPSAAQPTGPTIAITPHVPDGGPAMPEGTRRAMPNPDGTIVDSQTGATLKPDGTGQYLDPQGNAFHVVTPGAPLSDDQLQADFAKTNGATLPPPTGAPPPTLGSMAGQGARGFSGSIEGMLRGVAGMLNPVDQVQSFLGNAGAATDNIANLLRVGLGNDVKPTPFEPMTMPSGGPPTPALDAWVGQRPRNFPERAARTVGGLLPGLALGPEADVGLLGQITARAGNLLVPSATSLAASETTRALGGDQGAQDLAGNLGAAGGGLLANSGAGGLLSAPVRALDPFMARISAGAAKTQAGRFIAGNASDLPAVRASLAGGVDQIVPGSMPTTFQQTGDMGLGALERGVTARSPGLFQDRAADQNAARVGALGSIQTGADPLAVTAHIKGTFDNLDAQTQAHVDALTAQAQAKGGLLGGANTPEAYGAQTRDIVNQAEAGARAREGGLWNAVDPNGDLTGNTVATSRAASDIAGALPSTAKPMSGEEAGIFASARNLPAVAPVQDLIALRSRVSTEMRNELITQGRSAAYARMAQLRGAIQDNLANTVSDAVQSPAVAARYGAWNDAQGQPTSIAASNVGGRDYQPGPAGDASPQGGVGRTAFPQDGGFGSPAGAPRLSDQIPPGLTPVTGRSGVTGYTTPTGENISTAMARRWAPASELGPATADINLMRTGQTGGIFKAMQDLGGVRLRYSDGSLVPGPDVAGALQDVKAPGLVNNHSGLPPEQMAQALHEKGFFGPNVEDPSSAFEEAVREHAQGRRVYAQGAYDPGTAQRIGQLEQEAHEAGVTPLDPPAIAAAKLANYRAAQGATIQRAQSLGIDTVGRHPQEVQDDLAEREAIRAADADHPWFDPHAAEFDRLFSSGPKPTFDPAAAQRLAFATAATKARAATFGQRPISTITANSGGMGQYRLPDGSVAGRFFHPGPTGWSDMQALRQASPEAMPVIQDYAASTLRRAAMNEDGTLDPGKFSRWQAQHADAIRALPADQQAKFADASTASQAVADAAVNRAQTLKAAQSGAVGKIMGAQSPEEVTGRIGTILGSPTRVSDMDALARATAGNADARAGLRQAVADHIAAKFISNTEAGTSGIGTMKADPFQTFVRQAQPALAKVLKPDEIEGINAIAADIARSKRSQTAVKLAGSNTTQDTLAAAKLPGAGAGHTVGRVILDMIMAGVGEHLHPAFGSELGMLGGEMVNAIRAQGIARVNDLITRAMLEPPVARALLQRVPNARGLTPKSMQGTVLIRALAGPAAMGASQFNPPRKPPQPPRP